MRADTRLMSFSANGVVKNHTAFGEHLQEFLTNNQDILPGYGWMDGGCLVLTQAMRVWAPGELNPIAWVSWSDGHVPDAGQELDDRQVIVQHYAVTLECDGIVLVMDGDGMGTLLDFEEKMTVLEQRPGFIHPNAERLIIASDDRSELEVSLSHAAPYISETVKRLRHEFGDFSLELTSLDLPLWNRAKMTM